MTTLFVAVIMASCNNNNPKKVVFSDDTPDGYYAYTDDNMKIEITISGDNFTGTHVLKSSNITKTLSGKVSGRNLIGDKLLMGEQSPYEKEESGFKKENKIVGKYLKIML